MAEIELQNLPNGITVGGIPGATGNVTKLDCLNVATVENCIDPVAVGDPVTLNYYQTQIQPFIRSRSFTFLNSDIITFTTGSVDLLPSMVPNGLTLTLETGPYLKIENSNYFDPTGVRWFVNGVVNGIAKNSSIDPALAFAIFTSYFITEDGTNGTTQYALQNNGDTINTTIMTTTGTNPTTNNAVLFVSMTRLATNQFGFWAAFNDAGNL